MGVNIHELNSVVDEVFRTMEEIKSLFANWEPSCSLEFIRKAMYLNVLRERIYKLGFDDDFTDTVYKIIYHNVFTKAERSYLGELLCAANISASDLRREIAILLFQQDKLTPGQASEFAGASQLEFQRLLAKRHIAVHYDTQEFTDDLNTLRQMGQL